MTHTHTHDYVVVVAVTNAKGVRVSVAVKNAERGIERQPRQKRLKDLGTINK